ncbi:MAG: hypothetical protein B6I24_01380 [Bacteroidetes bacterium 4572_128]|nr:MAG: hypothetical protein B6I24_01380 [Bacteroidetes bacterium 4572_128]
MKRILKNIFVLFLTVIFLITVLGFHWIEHKCFDCNISDIHFFENGNCNEKDFHKKDNSCHKKDKNHEEFSDFCCYNIFNYLKIENDLFYLKIKKFSKKNFLNFLSFFFRNSFLQEYSFFLKKKYFQPPKKLFGKFISNYFCKYIL